MKFGLEWAHRHRQIRLVLSMPASALFNTWVNFTCTAYDEQTNTVITDYNGIVHFTPNGGGVNVGAGHITGDSYLVNGTLTGSVYFTTGGAKSISANDTVDGSIVGTSNGCNIIPTLRAARCFTPRNGTRCQVHLIQPATSSKCMQAAEAVRLAAAVRVAAVEAAVTHATTIGRWVEARQSM